jgi:hypothetical protein
MRSPNPSGKAKLASDSFGKATKPRPGKPAGSDGVATFGGFLIEGERNSKLRGSEKWITYDNLIANVAIVATAVRISLDLMGSVKWYAKPNPAGGARAQECADLHNEVLFGAAPNMTTPWRSSVKRQGLKKYRGFAMHEMVPQLWPDGRYGVDLQHRPQWSVYRWDKPDEQQPWQAIEQRTRMGNSYVIERPWLFYSVENVLGDDPSGVGLLRHMVEPARLMDEYKRLEQIGFETDMRGARLVRAPLAKLAAEAVTVGGCDKDDAGAIRSYVLSHTDFLTNFAANPEVVSDRHIMLDSATLLAEDNDGSSKPTNVYEWNVETIKATVTGFPDLARSIHREARDIACVMCAEWLMMGDSEGARAVHGDKTKMFGLVLNGTLDDIADDATRDIAPNLTAWNGYPPECIPRYEHEPIPTASLVEAATVLEKIAKAALHPEDEAPDKMRERMELPPRPRDKNGKVKVVRPPKKPKPEPDPMEQPDDKPPPDDKGEKEGAE